MKRNIGILYIFQVSEMTYFYLENIRNKVIISVMF